MKKVVVIGANAAGMSSASQVKRQKPDWQVIVLEKGPYISYAACGIPYYVQGLVSELKQLVTVTAREALEDRGLELRLNWNVKQIDPVKKTVTAETPDGILSESFDFLVIATGGLPLTEGISFSPSPRIFTINSLSDGEAIRSLIDKFQVKKCAVIGGGYIAIEMLEAFKVRSLETHLIHRRDELAASFEKEISHILLEEMKKEGVILNLKYTVSSISSGYSGVTVHTDKGDLDYDLAVIATGVKPNSKLAADCGIATGVKNAIRVNEYMQTNYPYIYSAGDCAETRHLVNGKPFYAALALKANREGLTAGANICGGREVFRGILGTAITKFCNLGVARTGLTLAEAEKNGFKTLKYKLSSNSKAHYYPGNEQITAIIIANKENGHVLGAQLAGAEDSVKRIDVYATAIASGLTVEDLFHLDLAYAPPFSPVYDPVILSGRIGRKNFNK